MANSMITYYHYYYYYLIILLSVFNPAVLARSAAVPSGFLAVRQAATTTTTPTASLTPASPQCLSYSTIANISTIGSNSTYRTAFLQASPVGTGINQGMFNAAIQKLPPLTIDANLNAACGNLTTIAFTEAERNFTMGTVLQFTNVPAKLEKINNGIVMVPVAIGMTLTMMVFGASL